MYLPTGGFCPPPSLTTKNPSPYTEIWHPGTMSEQIHWCWGMRLEVSLPSFKLEPFPTLKIPPSTIMGVDVWSLVGGFKSCLCHLLPLVPRLALTFLLVCICYFMSCRQF